MSQNIRVLIVDDAFDDAELIAAQLKREGFDAEWRCVSTLGDVQAALADDEWDVVLTDHVMPSLTSLEVVDLVRDSPHKLPVLLVSGRIGEEAACDVMRAGAARYVAKDRLVGLGPAVSQVLEETRKQRRLETALAGARDALERSEERYRFLFSHSPVPTVVYDLASQRIVGANPAVSACYGYSPLELESMTVLDLVAPEDIERVKAFLAEHPDGVEPWGDAGYEACTWRHRHKNGELIDVEVASANVTIDGRACRIALCQDVSARERVAAELVTAREQALEASRLKSAFLANVSHEIRTPMNGVIGMNDLLADSELDDEQRFYVEQVAQCGQQMLAVINDILDLSKIEAGRLELNHVEFDLHEALRGTCSLVAPDASTKGLTFALDLEPGVPQRVQGDEIRLRQIALNLLANAVKFTSAGEVRMRVSATPIAEYVVRLRIAVSDTGIGIEPERLDSMFEPFTQADTSTTRLYRGTGLGLSIVRQLAELMGGAIGAVSEPEQGSTFWVELPLSVVGARQAVPAAGSAAD